jgi:hypothetical protein
MVFRSKAALQVEKVQIEKAPSLWLGALVARFWGVTLESIVD